MISSPQETLTLPRRIVLLVLAVTGVAVIIASSILIRHQETLFRTELERRSTAIARTVAEYCVGPLAFDDREGANAILRGLTSSALVRNAVIYRADGEVFASHRSASAPVPEARAPQLGSTSRRFEAQGLVVVVPIGYRGHYDGMLRLVISTQSLAGARRELLMSMAMIVAGLLFASTFLASWLQRFVTRPLLSLAETMAVVARDARYDTRVSTNRRDEIGKLQSVFDQLLARLARRERERDASEASLRALVAALPDVVVVLDSAMKIVDAPMPRRIGGSDTTDLVGHGLELALPQHVAVVVETAVREALELREIRTVQFELEDGPLKKSFEAVASPMPSAAEAPESEHAILLVRDVTERKSFETRTQQAEKLQAIGQLAGGIAHDFNNMLAVIMTNATLIDRVSPQKGQVLLHDLRGAAQRATDLVSQLLAFARRKNAVRVRTDVNELVERVVRIVSRTVDPRIRIRAEFGAAECYVEADVAQLESALINLALNARDAMPEGGEIVYATRWVTNPDDEHASLLEITVTDTGSGIPPDVLPRIFEPFFTTKPVGSGTGLGLSAVYGTVQSQGGTLTVETEVDRGTTFRIRLPMTEGSDELASTPPESPLATQATGRILFVEDDPAVRESTRYALEHAGFIVEAFESGIDALERVRDGGPIFEVALVDNVMPAMTGRELIRQLRHFVPTMPILLCSGGDIEADDAHGAARPDDFLAKPYRLAELKTRIELLMKQGRSSRLRASRPPSNV
jgi:signal transduction histidine kinase/uncharacterized membrane protein affecting hemolysin expression/ActR/RegA family two-component response regulator